VSTARYAEYTAIYPATPKFTINGRDYNLIENLRKFVESFAQSLKEALSGRKIILVRIAHVGESNKGFMRKIYSATPETVFVPISSGDEPNEYPNARGFYKCIKYIGAGGFEPRCVDNFPDKALHADPLIFAKSGDRHIESITYGENDVEPKILWYHLIKEMRLDTSKIDAYVLFNSTFRIADEECMDLQILHGGFKATMWNPPGCFEASTPPEYCLPFPQVDKQLRSRMLERVQVNPHWIQGDYVNESVSDFGRYILMMIGNESSWFFSLPIAPPPLYFLAQGSEKIVRSRSVIRMRLGRDEDEVRNKVSEVLETYGLHDLPEDVRKDLYEFLNSYYSGEISNLVVSFKKRVEEILKRNYEQYKSKADGRAYTIPELLKYFSAIPQCKIDEKYKYKRKYIKYGNYSYLDFLVIKEWREDGVSHTSNEERYSICTLAWVFGLSLLVLLGSYIRFVERAGG